MKLNTKKILETISNAIETFIAIIIILGIILVILGLFRDIYTAEQDLLNNTLKFDFQMFLSNALKLVIGIEFVKMLIKHTPESVIDVLLFAVARKLVVDSVSTIDLGIGVLSIILLFILKKYISNTTT